MSAKVKVLPMHTVRNEETEARGERLGTLRCLSNSFYYHMSTYPQRRKAFCIRKISSDTELVYGRNFNLYLMKSLSCCCVVNDSTRKKNFDEFRGIAAYTTVTQYLITNESTVC